MFKRLMLFLAVGALMVAACTPQATQAPPPTSAPTEAAMPEPTQPPRATVRMGFGGTIPLGHPGVYVGLPLGFWEEENIDFEVLPNDGSTQSLQLLQAGEVNFIQVTPETVIQAQQQGVDVVGIYTVNAFSTEMCTLPDSDITDIAQLQGRKVGVPSPTSGMVYFVRAMLLNAGLDPETDVEMVPTGFGPAGAELLANGEVDIITYWGGWYVTAEELGYEFRCFNLPELVTAPGHVIATMRSTIEQDPGLVERVGRAYAKSIVYAIANPEATAQIYFDLYPEAQLADVPLEEQLASNARQVEKTLEGFVFSYPGWQHGHNSPEGWAALTEYMVETDQLPESVPADRLIDNSFVEAYNNFDVSAAQNASAGQ